MTIFTPQNPGIGGLKELTEAEELFLTYLASLDFNEGDHLKIIAGLPAWLPDTSSGVSESLAIAYAVAL